MEQMNSALRTQALQRFESLLSSFSKHQHENALPALQKAECIYLLAANSPLGRAYAKGIADQSVSMGKRVILVDDTLKESPIADWEVIGSRAFVESAPKQAIAANLALSPFGQEFFSSLAAHAGIQMVDAVPFFDALGLPMVYQTASVMREETLARLDDYLALARKLDDAWSIQTLASCLAMRVHIDRSKVLPTLCSPEDEYFSAWPAGKDVTFALGEEEVFIDVGACFGDTVKKVLAATHWKYKAVHAFEPDSMNMAAMQRGIFPNLQDFHLHNMALSDAVGTMTFAETGTMGSHLDEAGGVQVRVSRLDDEVADATFIKMDTEGHEMKVLQGARRIIGQSRPRMAITGYHYAGDLLGIAKLVHDIVPEYRLRLRHHSFWYYDTILYADVPS
jgi:FkbM family methyltransferase